MGERTSQAGGTARAKGRRQEPGTFLSESEGDPCPSVYCVTSGKSRRIPEPQFPHLSNGPKPPTCSLALRLQNRVWELKRFKVGKVTWERHPIIMVRGCFQWPLVVFLPSRHHEGPVLLPALSPKPLSSLSDILKEASVKETNIHVFAK